MGGWVDGWMDGWTDRRMDGDNVAHNSIHNPYLHVLYPVDSTIGRLVQSVALICLALSDMIFPNDGSILRCQM